MAVVCFRVPMDLMSWLESCPCHCAWQFSADESMSPEGMPWRKNSSELQAARAASCKYGFWPLATFS